MTDKEDVVTAADEMLAAFSEGVCWNDEQREAIREQARREGRQQAFEEAWCIYPKRSETFEYQDSGYASGWFDAAEAYRAAIRAKAQGEER